MLSKSSSQEDRSPSAPRVSHRRHRVLTRVVSRRRKISVLLLFVVLTGAIYVWFRLTDRQSIQGMARDYLDNLLAGEVTVERASFDVFDGVWLYGVKVVLPGDPMVADGPDGKTRPLAVLEIGSVHLRHRPAALLVGKFVPREIVVSEPEANLVEFIDRGGWNVQHLVSAGSGAGQSDRPPIIRVRGGRINFYQFLDGRLTREGSREVFGYMAPRYDDPGTLEFRFELPVAGGAGRPPTVRGRMDMATAKVSLTGHISFSERLRSGMPRRMRQLLEMFAVRGSVDVGDSTISMGFDKDVQWDTVVHLRGVSARVPIAGVDVAVHGVCGRVRSTHEGFELTDLSGFIEGVPFSISRGFVANPDPATGGISGPIDLTVHVNDAYLPAVLGGRLHRLLTLVAPRAAAGHASHNLTGRISGVTHISRSAVDSPVKTTVEATVSDGTYISDDFPYMVDRIAATLRYADGRVKFLGATGQHGETELTVSTCAANGESGSARDLRIQAKNVKFDKDLLAALDSVSRKAIEELKPSGMFDFDGRIHNFGSPEGESWLTARIALLDVAINRPELGKPLERLSGNLYMTADAIEIRQDDPLHFARGPMTGTFSGKVQRTGTCPFSLRFDALDVPLAELESLKLSPQRRAAVRDLRLAGGADVTARVQGALLGTVKPDFLINVTLKDAGINWRRFPCALSNVGGKVRVHQDRILLTSIHGRHGDGKIAISGSAQIIKDGATVDVSLAGENIEFDQELRDALPAEVKNAWLLLNPAGRFDFAYRITTKADGKIKASGQVRPRGASIRYGVFPYELKQLTGTVDVLEDGTAKLGAMTAVHGDAKITIKGGRVRPSGGLAEVDLTFTASGISLDEDLRRALPWAVRKHWPDLKPSGVLGFAKSRLVFKPADAPGGTGYMTLKLLLSDVALQLGERAEGITGTAMLDVQASPASGTFGIRGSLKLAGMRYAKIAMTDIKGKVELLSQRNKLCFSDLHARVHGGHLAGSIDVHFKPDDTHYAAEVNAKGVQLRGIGRQLFGPDFEHVGSISGMLKVGGSAKDAGFARMEGRLLIEDAKLFRLPAIINVLRFLNFRKPEQLTFHEATVRFYTRNDRVYFDELRLRGKAVAMLGAGYFDRKTRAVRLALVVGPPENLPRVPLLEDIVKGLHLALTQVEVTGTLDKPQIRTRPFSDLDQGIRNLLRRER